MQDAIPLNITTSPTNNRPHPKYGSVKYLLSSATIRFSALFGNYLSSRGWEVWHYSCLLQIHKEDSESLAFAGTLFTWSNVTKDENPTPFNPKDIVEVKSLTKNLKDRGFLLEEYEDNFGLLKARLREVFAEWVDNQEGNVDVENVVVTLCPEPKEEQPS